MDDYRTMYTHESDYDRAIEEYTEAIGRDPFDAVPYLCRGKVYAAQKKYDQAIRDYDRAIGMTPDNAVAYMMRGDACLARKRYDEAVENYEHAIRIDDNPIFREIKACSYYEQGCDAYAQKDYESAIAMFHKVLSPKFPTAHLGLGMVYAAQKKYSEAQKHFDKVLEKEPDNAAAYRYRGNAYFALASDDTQSQTAFGSIQAYRKKLEDYKDRLAAYKQQLDEINRQALAEYTRQNQQKKGQAVEGYKRQLLSGHRQDIETYERQIKEESEKDIAAYKDIAMDKFKERYGGDTKRYEQDISCYEKEVQKQGAEKREAFKAQLLESHTQDIAVYEKDLEEKNSQEAAVYESNLHNQQGIKVREYENTDLIKEFPLVNCCRRALEDYNQAIVFNANYGGAYYDRGMFYFTTEEYGAAAADFQKALEINPNDPNARYMLQKAENKQITPALPA
ncbi:MAG: tetratricopeptide repeat protein [Spirochaetaceae bacterium]|jgi:tetratricopeptide (TPR) repeat protein|nr:tetratricopeptide repeat protein [Spirochaetaceae bacterium]